MSEILIGPQKINFGRDSGSAISKHYGTGLHTQKAYTHTSTSSSQIPLLSAHAYISEYA